MDRFDKIDEELREIAERLKRPDTMTEKASKASIMIDPVEHWWLDA